jgi:hypothetical protein
MYPQQQQAIQLANQLAHVQSLAGQLQQAEQQEAAIDAQRNQIARQLNYAVANCYAIANQVAQPAYAQQPIAYAPQAASWAQNSFYANPVGVVQSVQPSGYPIS